MTAQHARSDFVVDESHRCDLRIGENGCSGQPVSVALILVASTVCEVASWTSIMVVHETEKTKSSTFDPIAFAGRDRSCILFRILCVSV